MRSTELFTRFLSAIVVAAALQLGMAQAADAAEAPQYKVGDTWKYGRTDLWRNERTEGWTLTVAGIADGQVRFDGLNERKENFRLFYTLDGNYISGGRNHIKPYVPQLSFPLAVGKTWSGEYEWKNRQGIYGTSDIKVKVLARETVTVPAGTFDAFKIESQGSYRRSDSSGVGSMRSLYWYAPSVKRIVREEYRDTTTMGQQWDQHITVLESYKLAQ